jgi:hypothetical protein
MTKTTVLVAGRWRRPMDVKAATALAWLRRNDTATIQHITD